MNLLQLLKDNAHFVGKRVITYFGVGIAFSLSLSASEIALGFLLQFLITDKKFDYVGEVLKISPQLQLSLALIAIGISRLWFQFAAQIYSTKAQETLNARLRLLIVDDLIISKELPLNISEVQSNITENFQKGSQFIYYCSQLLGTCIQCSVLLFAMIWSAPAESTLALTLFIVGIFCLLVLNRKTKERSKLLPGLQLSLLSHVLKNAKNHFLIHLYGTQKSEIDRTRQLVRDNYNRYMSSISVAYLSSSSAPFLGILVLSAVYYFSSVYMGREVASLVVFFYLFSRFAQMSSQSVQNIGYMGMFSKQYENSRVCFEAILKRNNASLPDIDLECSVINRNQKNSFQHTKHSTARAPQILPPNIKLENISMKLPNGNNLFDHLNINLSAGKHLGISGPSGTGKSSLLAGILGFRTISSGSVLFANQSIDEALSRGNLRIGYVGTDPYLIEGSIRDNLLYGMKHETSDQEIWGALEKVDLLKTIKDLPNQLDTLLGELGPHLSTGQQQRISFVRALLRNPNLLILDEATSNLDDASEELIGTIVRDMKGAVTVLIVSHRKKLLEQVDHHLILSHEGHRLTPS